MIKQPELGQKISKAMGPMTMTALAKKVGISYDCMYQIIYSPSTIFTSTVDKICRELMLDPDTLEPFASAWDDFPEKVGRDELSGVRLHLYRPEDIREWKEKYEAEIRGIIKK